MPAPAAIRFWDSSTNFVRTRSGSLSTWSGSRFFSRSTTSHPKRSVFVNANPIDKSFEEIEGNSQTTTTLIAERYHFHKREQAAGESVVQYLEELRRLAGRCYFGGYLDEALRDRFVCGLKNDHIQKGLMAEADLNLGKAIK